MHSRVLLDIGNTQTKWKFGDQYFVLPTQEFELDRLPESSDIWVSSVSNKSFDFEKPHITLAESREKYKLLINGYKDPKLLGSDRWLGMIASYESCFGKSFIVIDIGSAITIDIVNNRGIHLGGLIFPGLQKIRQTFNNFPFSKIENINGIGKSTEEAWTIGTLNLVVNSINKRVNKLISELPDALIFLTGGGYIEIRDFIEFDHDYQENLVLDGLEFYVNNMG